MASPLPVEILNNLSKKVQLSPISIQSNGPRHLKEISYMVAGILGAVWGFRYNVVVNFLIIDIVNNQCTIFNISEWAQTKNNHWFPALAAVGTDHRGLMPNVTWYKIFNTVFSISLQMCVDLKGNGFISKLISLFFYTTTDLFFM